MKKEKMTFKVDPEKKKIIVSDGDQTVVLTPDDINTLSNEVNETFYFRDDVINAIKDKIEAWELPEEALDNEKYIQSVLSHYASLRNDNEGEGIHWSAFLEEAFKENDYNDFQ